MAYGMTAVDTGYAGFKQELGGTWGGLPQFKAIDGAVSMEKAMEVLDFDIVKRESYGMSMDGGMRPIKNSFHLVREDTDTIIVPNVGNNFTVFNNGTFLNHINSFVLGAYPDLKIESVGTMFGGATSFINLMVNEFNVKGDDSPQINRLMFYNPLGKGSYTCGAHSIRMFCTNVLSAIKTAMKLNGSMMKFRHTKNAHDKISNHMVDLADTFLELKSFEDTLQELAEHQMTVTEVDAFLESMFPTSGDGKAVTRAKNKQQAVKDQFEVVQTGMSKQIARTSYAMLNAVTYVTDHPEKFRKNQDLASSTWDGLVGIKSDLKVDAMSKLVAQLV